MGNFLVSTALESEFTIFKCFIRLTTVKHNLTLTFSVQGWALIEEIVS